MTQTADYVVVGSGSAGAIIARRLADSGATVTLIEAGGKDTRQLVRKPGLPPGMGGGCGSGQVVAPPAAHRRASP